MNIKFIQNFLIEKLVKQQSQFIQWLDIVKDFSIYLINNNQTQLINRLLNKNFQLWSLIISQTQHNNKVPQELQDRITSYGIQISQNAVSKILLTQELFFQDFSYKSFKKYKSGMKKFFENLTELMQLNYLENVRLLEDTLNQIIQNQNIFVLSQQHQFDAKKVELAYEKLIICINLVIYTVLVKMNQKKVYHYVAICNLSDEQEQNIDPTSAQILANCFRFIQFEYSYNKELSNIDRQYFYDYQLVILYFLENYLQLTLEEIDRYSNNNESENKLKINQKYLPINMDYQEVIEVITQKLLHNLQINNKVIIDYTLFTLKRSLFKIKREISRQVFAQLPLIQHISNSLIKLNNTALDNEKFYKMRIQVFELIAILWLDDFHDDYLESTDKIVESIKQESFGNNNINNRLQILKFLRDSTGICQYLDVAKIFKYYIKIAFPFYQQLFNQQIVNFMGDNEVMNAGLDFLRAIFNNKASRYTYESQSNLGYQVFLNVSDFLVNYTEYLKNNLNLQSDQKDIDIKTKFLNKLFEILNQILKGKYLNLGVFKLFNNNSCIKFIKIMLDIKFIVYELVFIYPKCLNIYIDNIVSISDIALETIYEQLDISYVSNLFVLGKRVMKKLVENETKENQQQQLSISFDCNNLYNSEQNFAKISQMIFTISQFSFEEYNIKYQTQIKQNVQIFLQNNKPVIREFIFYLFDLSFSYFKTSKMLKVSKTLFGLVVIDQQSFNEVQQEIIRNISKNVQERDYLIKQFNNIMNEVQMKFDSLNEDKFQKNLKEAIENIQQNYAIKENTVQIIQY